MYEKKDWKDSEFTKSVRIKQEDLEFLKTIKKKKKIATVLSEIIDFYKNENTKRNN